MRDLSSKIHFLQLHSFLPELSAMKLVFLLMLVITSFLMIAASTQHCKKAAYSQQGYYLRNHLISTPNVKNIGQCLITCSQERRCRSINFKSLGSICELNDADKETDPGDYKVNTGYTYSSYPMKVNVRSKKGRARFMNRDPLCWDVCKSCSLLLAFCKQRWSTLIFYI